MSSLLPRLLDRGRIHVHDPFSLHAWNPFEELGLYLDPDGEDAASANTKIDWKETKDAHVFIAELPGVKKKEDVKVEVEGGTVLRISAERSKEEGDEKVKWHCKERRSGNFFRRFRLPEDGKADDVKAVLENGLLLLTVPKQKAKKSSKTKSLEIPIADKPKPKLKGCFCA
ncbi:hypothetical protein H6P81_006129 [Aristolochia fimbriata]|uniref:SHSP domain-containing protein n=1 Tax=Aristolochia fimbriata TaxID=158543 RepID=A0AAV7EWF6_ARIFI|nr:hypothetical protein H6P81_006129 [Aristolochia fimbriata]